MYFHTVNSVEIDWTSLGLKDEKNYWDVNLSPLVLDFKIETATCPYIQYLVYFGWVISITVLSWTTNFEVTEHLLLTPPYPYRLLNHTQISEGSPRCLRIPKGSLYPVFRRFWSKCRLQPGVMRSQSQHAQQQRIAVQDGYLQIPEQMVDIHVNQAL